jgi:lysophospholipase L1-like esterase
MLGSAPALLDRFGDRAIIDAKVARQAAEIAPVVRQLDAEGRLGATVVVQVGINGTVTEGDLRAISEAAPGRRLIVINGRVPRSWQDGNNATIGSVVPELPNATVLDWYRSSDGKRSWYLADGVHFNAEGQAAYAQEIAASVQAATEAPSP